MTIAIPEESILPDGFALYWTKKANAAEYAVIVDDVEAARVSRLDATVSGLAPGLDHLVKVEALDGDGRRMAVSPPRRIHLPEPFPEIDVRDLGARGEGSIETAAHYTPTSSTGTKHTTPPALSQSTAARRT